MAEPEEILLGYVAGAHGVRGALRVKLFNADSEALAPGVGLRLRPRDQPEGPAQELEITRFAPKPGSDMGRLWLRGVDSREAADALRGRQLWIDRALLPEIDEGEYYLADLVGLELRRPVEGSGSGPSPGETESLGTIVGVTSNGEQDLFVVELRGREWLLPAMPPFVTAIEDDAVIVDVHDDMLPEDEDRR